MVSGLDVLVIPDDTATAIDWAQGWRSALLHLANEALVLAWGSMGGGDKEQARRLLTDREHYISAAEECGRLMQEMNHA